MRFLQIGLISAWTLASFLSSSFLPIQGQSIPAGATRCAPSLPISVAILPLDPPAVAKPMRFRVDVVSNFDPDLVRSMELVYDLPPRVRQVPGSWNTGQAVRVSGRTRMELAVLLPDEQRYPIRARVIAHLAGGRDVSQTAVQWTGVSTEDRPAELTGRIVDPGGFGIRVYRGETVKEPQ
jgi:hypothetical protein